MGQDPKELKRVKAKAPTGGERRKAKAMGITEANAEAALENSSVVYRAIGMLRRCMHWRMAVRQNYQLLALMAITLISSQTVSKWFLLAFLGLCILAWQQKQIVFFRNTSRGNLSAARTTTTTAISASANHGDAVGTTKATTNSLGNTQRATTATTTTATTNSSAS